MNWPAQDVISSANEIKSRGAIIIGISNKNNAVYDFYIELPECIDYIYPIIEVIPLQIMAYYLALKMQVDPDYPRNLAKSVTVKWYDWAMLMLKENYILKLILTFISSTIKCLW